MYNSVSIRRKHLFESDDGWSCLPNNPQQKIRITPFWVFVNYIYTSESPKSQMFSIWTEYHPLGLLQPMIGVWVATFGGILTILILDRAIWGAGSYFLNLEDNILGYIIVIIYSFRCCPHHYGWYIPMKHTWLVVWDIFYFSIYIENSNSSWLIFFRGVETTNQHIYIYPWSPTFNMNRWATLSRLKKSHCVAAGGQSADGTRVGDPK